jgi:hypothetical protein
VSLISKRSMSHDALDAPILLTPLEGVLTHAPGARFADLSWHPSTSESEVAEIVEFAYNGDARLFTIFFSGRPPETEHFSSGGLIAQRNTWLWRVWLFQSPARSHFLRLNHLSTERVQNRRR